MHLGIRPLNVVRNPPQFDRAEAEVVNIPRHYVAPEGSHSSRADIFSFGKTLYEMCTGLPVQAFPSLPADMRFWEDHKTLLKINTIIGRACARDLRKRYDSAKTMLNDLESIWQG